LIKLDDIAHVDVAISNYAARRITDKYPQTEESAKFSGPYLAAYTLVHGAPMLAAFTDETLHDEVVRSLARKVSVATYVEYADVLEDSPAKVTLTLNDGRKIERSKYYPSGSMQVPMSPARIKAKFDICAAQAINSSAAEKIYVMLSTIDEQPSFAEFWPLCVHRRQRLEPALSSRSLAARPAAKHFKGAIMDLFDYLKAFFRPGAPPPAPRRLDGKSKILLAASLKMLPEEEPGWITVKEAKTFFHRRVTHMHSARWMKPGRLTWAPSHQLQGTSNSSSCRSRGGFTSCASRVGDEPEGLRGLGPELAPS
jgi:hypothetical protein